jgi:drug/metabolite transporter (DMT)-like permease
MEKQKQAYAYAITAVLFWSTAASAFKLTLRYLDYLQLLFYASIVSIAILFIILLMQNKLPLLKTYSTRDYLHSALLGLLNPFLYYVVLLKAYSLLRAQEAMTLNYTWSIMLVLLSIPLLRQKIGLRSIVAITIGFFGVVIVATKGDLTSLKFSNPVGVCLALASSLIWALFWLYNVRDKRDEVAKLFLNFAFGFVFILIAMLLSSRMVVPGFKGVLGVTYVGLFEMGVTFVLWFMALKLSRTTAKVSNLIFIAPFMSLIWIRIAVKEEISPSTIVGLVFIVAGIILQQYSSRTRPGGSSAAEITEGAGAA